MTAITVVDPAHIHHNSHLNSLSRWRVMAALLASLTSGQAAVAADLTVNFGPARTATGTVLLALFNSAETFPKPGKYFRVEMVAAATSAGTATFRDLPAGRYAVSVFHDENANGKLDMNLVGFPTELFGFSNDALGFGGPPTFEKAAVDMRGDTVISIQLR
jgi:uncharacterized protein (DUF2141 family)